MENIDFLNAFKVGGIGLTVIVSLVSLVVLFSKRYTEKDKAFTETIQKITSHFMEFVERKDVQSNATNQEYITAIRQMQQEIAKKGEVMRELASQIHEQNTILKAQNENIRVQHDRIASSELAIMEIKAQLHEVAFLIKTELIKTELIKK